MVLTVLDLTATAREAVFVSRRDETLEGDGYLLMLAGHRDSMLNELLVLAGEKPEDAPVATVCLAGFAA